MRKIAVIAFLLLSTPLLAQSGFEVGAHYAFVDPQGSNDFTDIGSQFDLDSGTGYGVSLGLRFGKSLSVEAAASRLETDAALAFDGGSPAPLGTLELTAVTGTLRYHLLGDSVIDPFIGGGVAWVDAGRLDGETLADFDLRRIDFDNDPTWTAEAGIRFRVTPNFFIGAGAKYIAYEPDSRAVFIDDPDPSDPVAIQINPLIITGGIYFRF